MPLLKMKMMNALWTRLGVSLLVIAAWTITNVEAQVADTPTTRLSPIDAPSAVDRYRPRSSGTTSRLRKTAYQTASDVSSAAPVRQVVWQQPQRFDAPALPGGGGFQLPASDTAPLSPPSLPPSSTTAPPSSPSLPPSGPSVLQGRSLPSGLQPVPSSSDLTPLAPPQLGGQFATVGNCCCVSAPSTYRAASSGVCGPSVTYETPQVYVPPPTEIPAPAVMPPSFIAPGSPRSTPRPLFSFGQELKPVQLGQGIIGQPVAYVPGERFRNALRYLFP